MDSRDSTSNKVRAKGRVLGPAADRVQFRDGTQPQAGTALPKGTVVLGATVGVAGRGVGTRGAGAGDLR